MATKARGFNRIHFKHGDGERETPQELVDCLRDEWELEWDVACTRENMKLPRGITREQDAFKMPWGARCFCNPPYGRGLTQWLERANAMIASGQTEVVVFLLPARTDTRWFHTRYATEDALFFIRGRIKFGPYGDPAPFPSLLRVLSPGKEGKRQLPYQGCWWMR